ncbi:amino acid aminotransferase [Alteromonas gilva]|uniref:Aspartate/tyrosine/aromatic aminotransferase n=1 Tax=Alteromonas gilva TaxID=2987522 RepID=A0ABT5L4H1_9ALTE|nr:amino acid aminotransferase [Alteromonas gilva]MDC8831948.1 aspartate/tyrosine/aromatic aminotransferase [Alteromonas gilva]
MFEHVDAYAGDPIFSLMEKFVSDQRPHKVNLTIGYYFDDNGQVPDFGCVNAAKAWLADNPPASPVYLPMDGMPDYRAKVQSLAFGESLPLVQERLSSIQSLGGSGALKVGADLLKRYFPDSQVWVSNPTWDNHHSIFKGAGLTTNTYRYYDPQTRKLDFTGMLEDLSKLPAQSIVLLHPCCHNPTGIDLTTEQWQQVIAIITERQLLAFFDMAYQGFSEGLAEDTRAIQLMAESGQPFLLAQSFSKIFSLYSERIGALYVVCETPAIAQTIQGQLKFTVRTNYSTPPSYGARLVSHVLSNEALTDLWHQELAQMRQRMHDMRQQLVSQLTALRPDYDFSYLAAQRGMFSYTGFSPAQVARLKDEFGVYLIDSGRMCIAGLNSNNLEATAKAFAAVC